ncbi:hypothetical protein [Streptomyces lunalinharesii]|uniref:Uncharacterized protein n=1 Tax=Streptomyces lunalinharesii TaxID=333384 RepID=A0ABP6DSZ7_9ACTN
MDAAGSEQADESLSQRVGEGSGGAARVKSDAKVDAEAPAGGGVGGDVEGEGEVEDGAEGDGRVGEEEGVEGERDRVGLTPRQARRVRVVLASVMMAAMAVLLVVRLASRTSVLVVGVYGAALILCGIVIELARNGRTRLGTWLLVCGLAAAFAADWLLP